MQALIAFHMQQEHSLLVDRINFTNKILAWVVLLLASGRCKSNSGVLGAGWWSSLLLMYALRRWFIYLFITIKIVHYDDSAGVADFQSEIWGIMPSNCMQWSSFSSYVRLVDSFKQSQSAVWYCKWQYIGAWDVKPFSIDLQILWSYTLQRNCFVTQDGRRLAIKRSLVTTAVSTQELDALTGSQVASYPVGQVTLSVTAKQMCSLLLISSYWSRDSVQDRLAKSCEILHITVWRQPLTQQVL